MRILVLGGTHGNELLGVKLVKLLQEEPIEGVDAIIANPNAVVAGTRFTESDLNRSFGGSFPGTYETKRAAELNKLAAGYDVVLDFHNTQTPNNNCGFVGVGCDPRLYDVAKAVGFSMCVEATYDCINKYCLNAISIEISIDDLLDDPRAWRKKIASLAAGTLPVSNDPLQLYRFSRRVSWEEKAALGLKNWKPFKRISAKEVSQLDVKKDTVPIFIGSHLTGEYATLLSIERSV
jgi:hypothetical protein